MATDHARPAHPARYPRPMSDDQNVSSFTAEQVNDFNAHIISEFRANAGRVTGQFANTPLMLLTHTGAKSGVQRTSPLAFTRDGDNVVLIASKAGSPTHPHWYLNVVANPEVTVEVGAETFQARAVVAVGEERTRLYRAMAAQMPVFDGYQAKTDRQIPVVVLERI
jgi:deazaflavin-dependent oxidoreductase (nitroreductase family)